MDSLEDVTDLIKRAIVEDPPLAQKDGGIIKEGYNEDVDKFRRSRTDGKKMAFRTGGQRAGAYRHQNNEDQI